MIDLDILQKSGLTEARLREIFEAEPDGAWAVGPGVTLEKGQKAKFVSEDETIPANPGSNIANFPENPTPGQIRWFFEDRIQSRLDEGIERNMRLYRLYQAVDLAMDGTLINQAQLPLQLMAQGYINFSACQKELAAVSPELAAEVFEHNDKGDIIKVNAPRLWEVSHNLVHSLVTRRVASVSTPIRQRHPMLKYEPRDTSSVGALKGELMTQHAEKMVDDYGYRRSVEQTARDVSCYGHQVEFVTSPWDRQTQRLKVRKPKTGADDVGGEELNFEEQEVIIKEGLDFVAPHPSRVFWDTMHPLAKINSDTGPGYIGYWDMARIGELRTDRRYWNRDAIEWDGGVFDLMSNNRSYFTFYYKDRIAIPEQARGGMPGLKNDRLANIADLNGSSDDSPITLGYYFEKVNPKQWGICDYDHDVWLRFIVAGNRTVIWADVLADAPSVYYGYNENDQRTASPAFAHMVIPYQDQISNLLSQLLEIQHQGLLRLYSINIDGMDKDTIAKVESALQAKQYVQARAIILKYSAEGMRNMGIDPGRQHSERVRAVEVSTSEKTTEIFRSIMNLLSMAERLLFFSPQELGQVAPREVTATEANMVNNTTLGIRDFHSLGIEEGLDAKKRLIYSASLAFGDDSWTLPAMSSFSRATVEAAGFQIVAVEGQDDPAKFDTIKHGKFTLSGRTHDLSHNFVFTSRDGTERTPSSAIAQASVQLLEVIGRYPMLSQALPLEDGVNMINGVARSLGLSVQLRVPEGMDPLSPMSGNPQQQFAEFAQGVQQALQALAQGQAELTKNQQALAQAIAGTGGQPGGAPPIPTTIPDEPQAIGMQ